jgi:hypothetical protein
MAARVDSALWLIFLENHGTGKSPVDAISIYLTHAVEACAGVAILAQPVPPGPRTPGWPAVPRQFVAHRTSCGVRSRLPAESSA